MASTPTEQEKPRRRRLTRWRVLLYTFLLLLALAEAAFLYFTKPERIIAMASEALTRMTGADVQIENAYFGLDGTIRLYNVRLTVPGVPGDPAGGNQLFTATQVVIEHRMAALLVGQLDVQTIDLIQPTFYPTEDVDHDRFTFQYLKPARKEKEKEKDGIRSLPEVRLNYALLVFGEIENGKYRALDTVQLNGGLKRDAGRNGQYAFALREPRGHSPFVLSGDFDLANETMSASVQFGQITPGDRRLNLLPRSVRSVIEKLQPTGTLQTIRFGLGADQQLSATIEVADGSVRIPLNETQNVLVKDTRGFVKLTDSDHVELDLTGKVEGEGYTASYGVKGTVRGLDENAAFDADIHLDGVIPEDFANLEELPRNVRGLLARYGPEGRFVIDANLQREPSTATLITSGTLRLVNSSLRYSRFPYPLREVNGTIDFENDRIDINNLTGYGPGPKERRAKVVINGHVIGNGRDPGVVVTVDATGVPLDDAFYAALREDERETFNMFFSPQRYAALIDEKNGLIQTSDQHEQRQVRLTRLRQVDNLLTALALPSVPMRSYLDANEQRLTSLINRPVFDLGGTADAHVDVYNYPGVKEGDTIITIRGVGMNMLYARWPYPMTVQDGKLIIRIGENVEIVGGVGKGVTGGIVTIDGKVEVNEDARRMEPKLKVTGKNAPIDDFLIASIPAASARWVRSLKLDGMLQADGRIFTDDEGETDFRIGITLAGGKAQPNGGQYTLDRVEGSLTVHPGGVDIQAVTGRRGESVLKVSSNDEATTGVAGVTLEGTKMQFDDPLLDLIPHDDPARAQLDRLLTTYKPSGEFDFKLSDTRQTDGLLDYRFEIHPRSLTFTLHGQEVAVKEATGWAEVSRDRVVLHDLAGRFPDGQFRIDGSFSSSGDGKVNLNFDIESEQFCRVTRVLVPPPAVSVIDALQFAGRYKVTGATLTMDPQSPDEVLTFHAPVQLKDADAMVGVKLSEFSGDLEVAVTKQREGEPMVSMKVLDARTRAADRFIDQLSMKIAGTGRNSEYLISKLKGQVYGGTLTGSGKVWNENSKSLYQMEVALQEVRLDPFLAPLDPKFKDEQQPRGDVRLINDRNEDNGSADGDTGKPPVNDKEPIVRKTEGLVSASLSIEGETGNPQVKRGRGEVRIQNAKIVQAPVGMAVLNVLNLGAPTPQVFERVDVSYLLDGDTVHFDRIVLEAADIPLLGKTINKLLIPKVSITGKGTMKYSTQELDLLMVSGNAHAIDLGALTDVLRMLRQELISIEVKGTLTDPKASINTLRGLRNTAGEVIGKPKD